MSVSSAWAVTGANSRAEQACATLLEPSQTADRGRPVSSPSLSFLGQGEHATAYLHLDTSGQPIVKKIYFEHSRDQIRSDFEALRYLERHIDAFPFRLARALSRHEDHLLMEYAPGTNLEQLMKSSTVSNELKSQLKTMYLEKLGRAVKFFEERCFDYQYRSQSDGFGKAKLEIPHSLRASCDGGNLFLEYIIKSDNIIVDLNNMTMTIVDPY